MSFTNEELHTISDGLLALIKNVSDAEKLVCVKATHAAIKSELDALVALNSKVCGMMTD